MKQLFLWILIALSLGIIACHPDNSPEEIEGYKPVYLTEDARRVIKSENPRTPQQPGKIYYNTGYLYVNEIGKGVHIFDNTNPESPKNLAFINIPGNVDIAVKGNILYADNVTDLVAIDVSNPNTCKLEKRIEGLYKSPQMPDIPSTGTGGTTYFECIEPNKGTVVAWEKATLHKPKCYR